MSIAPISPSVRARQLSVSVDHRALQLSPRAVPSRTGDHKHIQGQLVSPSCPKKQRWTIPSPHAPGFPPPQATLLRRSLDPGEINSTRSSGRKPRCLCVSLSLVTFAPGRREGYPALGHGSTPGSGLSPTRASRAMTTLPHESQQAHKSLL